ncbi:pirin family protein [Sphingomonas profundi]|uniref:pirin family protein n=1 Tax=Alterirhizorhabdus profundi TaxID=2681549 RepID=UPI0012E71816|nr:pirin family protein [Sphingomonas profundi]
MAFLQPDRRLLGIVSPARATHGDAFSAWRVGRSELGAQGNPFFNLDHFSMRGPTFPPHPHAGFSAVTYVLPESAIGMTNRDSRGDRSAIPPGGLHWTAAGSGIVHEEVPDLPGAMVEGMQIFVRQPQDQEVAPPRIHHVDADAIPLASLPGGGWLRILAGRYESLQAAFAPPSPLALIDVKLAPGGGMTWPDSSPQAAPEARMPWTLLVYLFRGALDLGEGYPREIRAPAMLIWETGLSPVALHALETDARFLILSGEPLDQPSIANGPFVMSSEDALRDAVSRFKAGAMGRI